MEELKDLLAITDEVVPIGNTEWEEIWERHNEGYAERDHTVESLKRKFQELVRKKYQQVTPIVLVMFVMLNAFFTKLYRLPRN